MVSSFIFLKPEQVFKGGERMKLFYKLYQAQYSSAHNFRLIIGLYTEFFLSKIIDLNPNTLVITPDVSGLNFLIKGQILQTNYFL